MSAWVLILVMSAHLERHITTTVVPGFATEESCLAAGNASIANFKWTRALCVKQ